MSDEKVLHGARLIEQGTMAGPMVYRVEALWHPSPGWTTVLTTHDRATAERKAKELIDGLDATDNAKVVWEWFHNNNHVRR